MEPNPVSRLEACCAAANGNPRAPRHAVFVHVSEARDREHHPNTLAMQLRVLDATIDYNRPDAMSWNRGGNRIGPVLGHSEADKQRGHDGLRCPAKWRFCQSDRDSKQDTRSA